MRTKYMIDIWITYNDPYLISIEFPTHKSKHELTSEGPIKVITFGDTRSLGCYMGVQRVRIPNDHAMLVIRDGDDRLICEWEPVEED